MPSLRFRQRSLLELSLVPRDTNSLQQCFNPNDQPIPCPPVFNFTTVAVILVSLTVLASITLSYVSWRFYRKRVEEKRIEEQIRQLTVLQNQSIRETREAVNSKNYRRLPEFEEDEEDAQGVDKPLPTPPNKSIFRKFWK